MCFFIWIVLLILLLEILCNIIITTHINCIAFSSLYKRFFSNVHSNVTISVLHEVLIIYCGFMRVYVDFNLYDNFESLLTILIVSIQPLQLLIL